MSMSRTQRRSSSSLIHFWLRLVVVVLPSLMLVLEAQVSPEALSEKLYLGASVALLIGTLALVTPGANRKPLGVPVIAVYLLSLVWMWIVGTQQVNHWFMPLTQGILLVVPVFLFGMLLLQSSGALSLRQARLLIDRLVHRGDWPRDLAGYAALPEVRTLSELLESDPTPALAMLAHPKAEVRLALLCALQPRTEWTDAEVKLILRTAKVSSEPAVRAAALRTLALVKQQKTIETISKYVFDPAPEVRAAAMATILTDAPHRWGWISFTIHAALSDPKLAIDGPLDLSNVQLPPQAVRDLTQWAAETGVVSVRAAQTLAQYYRNLLCTAEHPTEILTQLKEQVANPHSPAVLRVELAQLLHEMQQLDNSILSELLDRANPTPLRLMAIESILKQRHDPDALAALRDIARQQNRELALLAAQIVQRYLGVDMGLEHNQPLPAAHSRQAAEVARRVLLWGSMPAEGTNDRPPSGQRPASSAGLPSNPNVRKPEKTGSGSYRW
jgi:hypothetical protein